MTFLICIILGPVIVSFFRNMPTRALDFSFRDIGADGGLFSSGTGIGLFLPGKAISIEWENERLRRVFLNFKAIFCHLPVD